MQASEVVCEARPQRVTRLLAKVRARQLKLAQAGRIIDSARFARRARLVRELAARMALRH